MNPTALLAYLALFGTVGFCFLFVALLLGRFFRARMPIPEKLEPYECGEPTIGPSFVQFDSRFYVVALLFIVFEVEAAFFFPWASVYGRAVQLMRPAETIAVSGELSGGNDKPEKGAPAGDLALNGATTARLRDLGVRHPQLPVPAGGIQANEDKLRQSGRLLAKTAIVDIGVFFGILLVGFAYVWKRGDLDWVRALGDHAPVSGPPKDPGIEAR